MTVFTTFDETVVAVWVVEDVKVVIVTVFTCTSDIPAEVAAK